MGSNNMYKEGLTVDGKEISSLLYTVQEYERFMDECGYTAVPKNDVDSVTRGDLIYHPEKFRPFIFSKHTNREVSYKELSTHDFDEYNIALLHYQKELMKHLTIYCDEMAGKNMQYISDTPYSLYSMPPFTHVPPMDADYCYPPIPVTPIGIYQPMRNHAQKPTYPYTPPIRFSIFIDYYLQYLEGFTERAKNIVYDIGYIMSKYPEMCDQHHMHEVLTEKYLPIHIFLSSVREWFYKNYQR